jgi:hypothetical protein
MTEPIKIQICDDPKWGCGRIIRDTYDVPQVCHWYNHPDYAPPKPGRNAPLMRQTTVLEDAETIANDAAQLHPRYDARLADMSHDELRRQVLTQVGKLDRYRARAEKAESQLLRIKQAWPALKRAILGEDEPYTGPPANCEFCEGDTNICDGSECQK